MPASVSLVFNCSPCCQVNEELQGGGVVASETSYCKWICANIKLLSALYHMIQLAYKHTKLLKWAGKDFGYKQRRKQCFEFVATSQASMTNHTNRRPFQTRIFPDLISVPECHLCLAISTISWKGGLGFHYLPLFQWAIWPARTLTFLPDKTNQEQCLPSSIFICNTALSQKKVISQWPCLPYWVRGSYSTDSLLSELVESLIKSVAGASPQITRGGNRRTRWILIKKC